STNYAISYVAGTWTVTPAPLTITADNKTSIYGHTPTFTVTPAGLVNGDTLTSATTGTLSFSPAADPTKPVGTYTIVPSGLSSTNYAISYVNGTWTVTPAPLTITADNKTTTYGQTTTFTITPAVQLHCDPLTSPTTGTLSFTP